MTWRETEQIKVTQDKNFISSYLICSFGEVLRSVVEEVLGDLRMLSMVKQTLFLTNFFCSDQEENTQGRSDKILKILGIKEGEH